MVEDTPDDVIHDLFAERSLGRGIRSAVPSSVTGRSCRASSGTPSLDYFREEYCPERITIAVAGHVRTSKWWISWATGFDGFRRPAMPRAADAARPGDQPRHRDRAPARAGALRAGRSAGLEQDAPERYALFLLNDVIGGSMSSRLFQEVRERQGLVYSVHSGNAGLPGQRALLRVRGHGARELPARW